MTAVDNVSPFGQAQVDLHIDTGPLECFGEAGDLAGHDRPDLDGVTSAGSVRRDEQVDRRDTALVDGTLPPVACHLLIADGLDRVDELRAP
ncbi:MAG: hypothetical protein V9F03_02065 [Microthrixaceae bacterium]